MNACTYADGRDGFRVVRLCPMADVVIPTISGRVVFAAYSHDQMVAHSAILLPCTYAKKNVTPD